VDELVAEVNRRFHEVPGELSVVQPTVMFHELKQLVYQPTDGPSPSLRRKRQWALCSMQNLMAWWQLFTRPKVAAPLFAANTRAVEEFLGPSGSSDLPMLGLRSAENMAKLQVAKSPQPIEEGFALSQAAADAGEDGMAALAYIGAVNALVALDPSAYLPHRGLCQEWLRRAEGVDHPWAAQNAHNSLFWTALRVLSATADQSLLAEAERHLLALEHVRGQPGSLISEAMWYHRAGLVEAHAGRTAAARDFQEKCLAAAVRHRDGHYEGCSRKALARLESR
jgi:hypothetical protein